jgi:predicted RNase H-like nuclease (RuvC/YqgF family)
MGDQNNNQVINALLKIRESFEGIKQEIRSIKEKNNNIEEDNYQLKKRIERIEELLSYNLNEKHNTMLNPQTENHKVLSSDNKDTLKKEMLNSLNKKRKDIIQMKILGMIRSKTMSLPEIKRLVVDELEYCSKATFYRYIKELSPHLKETEVYK